MHVTNSPRLVLCLLTLALAVGWAPRAQAGGAGWSQDMTAAMKQAASEKKDLLMDFTGSDWCGWCIRLNKEVFDQDAFKKEAPKKFVLVELDFPQDESKLKPEIKKQNQMWGEKLGVQGFPTIYLADEKGVPYAKTGYQAGGAEKYLEHLNELGKIRVARDQALASAAKAQGVDKAKHLDKALVAVGDELAFSVYADQVKEVVALDAKNAAGLKDKYEQKLKDVELQKTIAKIQEEFTGDNADATLKAIDDAVAKFTPAGDSRRDLIMLKVQILQSQKKLPAAQAIVDELLTEKGLTPVQSLPLMLAKADLLAAQNKADEALKIFDGLLALEKKGSNLTPRLHFSKARLLVGIGQKEAAGKAFDAAIETISDPAAKEQIKQIKAQVLAEEEKTPPSKPKDPKSK
jgi:thioredoxin-related protein